MRVSNEEKQKSRARILQAASRRFREHGIEGTGLADIMKDAGMTHGGFYKHFPDKDALVRAALAESFDSLTLAGDRPSSRGAAAFRTLYLSREHRDSPGQGCPIAALGAEVARANQDTRRVMTEGVEARIALLRNGQDALSREEAMRQLVQLIGAVVVARAVEGPLSDEIIAAVREVEPDGSDRQQPS
jgi:TetR/AcrR family transcriptional regulator, transcriptional repressor for nem operon